MNWTPLTSPADLNALIEGSKQKPQLIFKHSTTCPISSMALRRVGSKWQEVDGSIEANYLDLHQHRSLSNAIAEEFGIRHESPQALLIVDEKCVYHASHLDINISDIAALLNSSFQE